MATISWEQLKPLLLLLLLLTSVFFSSTSPFLSSAEHAILGICKAGRPMTDLATAARWLIGNDLCRKLHVAAADTQPAEEVAARAAAAIATIKEKVLAEMIYPSAKLSWRKETGYDVRR
jgi:hypothetical protein